MIFTIKDVLNGLLGQAITFTQLEILTALQLSPKFVDGTYANRNYEQTNPR